MIRNVCLDWESTARLDRAFCRKKKLWLINLQDVTFHKISNDFKLIHLKHMTEFWMHCDEKNPILQWDQKVTQLSSVFFFLVICF